MKSIVRIVSALMLAGMLGIVCIRGYDSGAPQTISDTAGQLVQAPEAAVKDIIAMAAGKIPALALTSFGNFTPVASVQIAGKNYTTALTSNANVTFLGVNGAMNVTVNPDMQDAAVKIAGKLSPIVIVGDAVLSIRACCRGQGGPELNLEYAKNNPAATNFILNSSIKIPLLDIDGDSILKYENGILTSHTEKHSSLIDAIFTINVGLPNPLVPATGAAFTLSGKFGQLLREKLIPEMRSIAQAKIKIAQDAIKAENDRIAADINNVRNQLNAANSQCNPPRVDTSSAGSFFSSFGRAAQSVVSNPQACANKARLEAELFAKEEIYRKGLLQAGSSTVGFGGTAAGAGLTALDYVAQTLTLDEASGSWTFDDMKNIRLPKLVRLKVTFTIPNVGSKSVTLTNLQFDFKDPVGSTVSIATALAQQIIQLIPGL